MFVVEDNPKFVELYEIKTFKNMAYNIPYSGRYSTAVGYKALQNNMGDNNVAIGAEALHNITTGTNNIGIGKTSDTVDPTTSNTIHIGNESHQQIFIGGIDIIQILREHAYLKKVMQSFTQKC